MFLGVIQKEREPASSQSVCVGSSTTPIIKLAEVAHALYRERELITSLFLLNDWINVLDLRKSNQQRDVQITLSYPQCLV
jgi:hypothetical protein